MYMNLILNLVLKLDYISIYSQIVIVLSLSDAYIVYDV